MRPSRALRGGSCLVVLTLAMLLSGGCGPRPAESPPAASPPAVGAGPPGPAAAEGLTVVMSGNRFTPDHLVVPAGGTVTFVNQDQAKHGVRPDAADSGGPNSDEEFPKGMKADDSYQWIAPANVPVGTVLYYHCRYRGEAGDGTKPGTGMAGAIEIAAPVPSGPRY